MATFSSSGTVESLAVLLLAAATAVVAQDSCAASLAAPEYPLLAREERLTGEVQIQFEITAERSARDVRCRGYKLLCESAEAAVRKTVWEAGCAGVSFELVLQYMLEGAPSADASTVITFRTPNRYLITSNPAPAKRNPRSSVQRPCATCSQQFSV